MNRIDPYFQNITPPAFAIAMMRMDTAFTALSNGLFQSDCEWFASHKGRSLLVRRESNGEFDPEIVPQTHPAFSVCLDKPPLWVLVQRVTWGIHAVIPVYRGDAFWQEKPGDYPRANVRIPCVSSDTEIANLLIEMQRLHGCDVAACQEWAVRYIATMQASERQFTATATGKAN